MAFILDEITGDSSLLLRMAISLYGKDSHLERQFDVLFLYPIGDVCSEYIAVIPVFDVCLDIKFQIFCFDSLWLTAM